MSNIKPNNLFLKADKIDIVVIQSFKKGNTQAFEKLYYAYHKRLYSFLYSLSQSHSESEEILQQTFIRIWEKRELYNESYPFEAFLFKVGKNTFLNYTRKKLNRRIADTDIELYNELMNDDVDDYLMLKETSSLIEVLIKAMPPKRQQIFRMQKIEGKSRKEISEELNISLATIDSHLAKANTELKDGLKKFNIIALSIFIR